MVAIGECRGMRLHGQQLGSVFGITLGRRVKHLLDLLQRGFRLMRIDRRVQREQIA